MRLATLYVGAMIAAAAAGAFIALHDAMSSLRGLVAAPVFVAWLRYPFFLLVSWAVIDPFFGSNVALITGNNLDLGLTAATLLLAFTFPIKSTFKSMPALPVFLLFLFWVLLGINVSPLDHLSFLKQWVIFIDYVAVAVITINVLTTRERMSRLIDFLLLVPVGIALYGIYGYAVHQNVITLGGGPARITSIFSDAPSLALLLSNVVPLALYRIFTSRGLSRLFALVSIAILLTAVALTFTRGAIISVSLCLAIMVFLLPTRRMKIAMVGLAALGVVVAMFANINLLERFSGSDVATFNGRTYLWHALLVNFDPTQLVGNGLHASDTLLTGLHIGQNGQLGNGLIASGASNLYIETLYNQGIIGLALLLLTFIVLIATLLQGLRKATGERRILFMAALLTLVNVIIQSFDLSDILAQSTGIFFWIVVASLPCAIHWSSPPRPTEAPGVLLQGPRPPDPLPSLSALGEPDVRP